MIQCRHVTCHACACAGCAALLDELEALRAECDVLETVAENRYATLLEMAAKRDREDQEMIAILTLCWFLRWVLDEDERRALRRPRPHVDTCCSCGVAAWLGQPDEMQRRGF